MKRGPTLEHTHSEYGTTLACLGVDLPAVHYMIGFAGSKVPCTPCANFGASEIAEIVSQNLGEYNAVLMANHGILKTGENIEKAFLTVASVEYTAKLYYRAKLFGEPKILSHEEIKKVQVRFKAYEQQNG